jgi:outer membrane protein insertion porin family
MKLLPRLCGLALLFACLPSAWAQFNSTLQVARIDIKHVGPAAVSDELIRSNIRVKVGDPYRRAAVDDDVQNLYATGLFQNIRVTDETTTNGMVLTYLVQGNLRLTEIAFEGNVKYKPSKLLKKMSSKVGEPMSERKLFTDCQAIQEMYQKAGYPGTKATAVPIVDESTGRAKVIIKIEEGKRMKIVRVEFVGASAYSQRKLHKVIKTRKHWFMSWLTGSGVYKADQFEDDRERLTQFYHENGYIDFEIKDVQLEYPSPRTLAIRIIVYEGQQYKVGSVTFTGNKLFSTQEIAKGMRALVPSAVLVKKTKLGPNGLKMDVGDVFTPKGLSDDEQQINDFYGARGYLDAAHGPPPRRIPNTERGTIDLVFRVEEGQKNYIEKIEIRGNTKTKDRVIRRELAVAPGEVFDMVHVNISKERLEGLQYFEKVDTRPEPTDVPNHKNLVIGVDEKNTGNLTVGAGFSSDDALVGFAEVTQGNFDLFHPPTFTGGGQKFRLRAQLGTKRQDYEMEFVEPWLMERHLILDVNLFYRYLDFLSPADLYHENDAGVRFSLERALGSERLRGTLGYSFEDVGIIFNNRVVGSDTTHFHIPGGPIPVPRTLLNEQGYALISKIFTSLAYDTRGPGYLPDRGQRTELSMEAAGPYGGVKDYYKLQLSTAWYFKGPFEGHVLELGGRTGVSDAYGSTAEVPFWDRYYLGGMYDLRGFRYHGISPRDTNPHDAPSREPIGGNTMWFGSAEYSIPIIDRLRFAAFYDIGAVNISPYSFGPANYNDNWGLGIRLNLPIGPLRLDYGIPIHHDKYNSGSGQFQFGVGYSRPF